MRYKNIASRFFGLVTKHTCAERQTDRQNYDSQDRASIAVLRGKNVLGPVTLDHLGEPIGSVPQCH